MKKQRSILALISERGGGDAPPVIALACALSKKGERVTLICDEATQRLVKGINLTTIPIPKGLDEGTYFDHWRQEMKGAVPSDTTPNPLIGWANISHSYVMDYVRALKPDLIISSLFCMGLAEALAQSFNIPWSFINPSFYFGDKQARGWQEDWYGLFVQGLAKTCFYPLSQRANLVLHGTDSAFDIPPAEMPGNHHYTGFLLWEPELGLPDFIDHPGDPWALVTVSTVPQGGELELARAAAWALSDFPVRTLLTLPYEQAQKDIGTLPKNTWVSGFVPHGLFMQRCSLVIGHAGHGLVSKALVHGIPMVLLPWHRDQPGVAERAERLGVARVVPREKVTNDSVKQAVQTVLDVPDYLHKAAYWSGQFSTRDPIALTCQLLESI